MLYNNHIDAQFQFQIIFICSFSVFNLLKFNFLFGISRNYIEKELECKNSFRRKIKM